MKKLDVDIRTALVFLKRCLASREAARKLIVEEYPSIRPNWWLSYLYPPHANVTLTFASDMLFRTAWVSKGLWDPISGEAPQTPMYMFPLSETVVDRTNGAIIFRDKAYGYSKIMFVTAESLSHDVKRAEGPIAIMVKGNPNAYMIQKEYFENLGFRLLFVHPSNTLGFRPLAYHPFVGGAWRVE